MNKHKIFGSLDEGLRHLRGRQADALAALSPFVFEDEEVELVLGALVRSRLEWVDGVFVITDERVILSGSDKSWSEWFSVSRDNEFPLRRMRGGLLPDSEGVTFSPAPLPQLAVVLSPDAYLALSEALQAS